MLRSNVCLCMLKSIIFIFCHWKFINSSRLPCKCLASDYLRVTEEDWLYQEQTICLSIYILSVAVKADPWSCIAYCCIVFGGPPIYQPNIVKSYVYTSIMHCSIILNWQQHIVTEKDISICIKVILFYSLELYIYIYVCVCVCVCVCQVV